jgi:hypothetical protein
MKLLNQEPFRKWKLPRGKLTCKWVKSRNVFQCYAGGKYIPTASGNTEREAWEGLSERYER